MGTPHRWNAGAFLHLNLSGTAGHHLDVTLLLLTVCCRRSLPVSGKQKTLPTFR